MSAREQRTRKALARRLLTVRAEAGKGGHAVEPSVWFGYSVGAAADPVRKHKENFLHGTD